MRWIISQSFYTWIHESLFTSYGMLIIQCLWTLFLTASVNLSLLYSLLKNDFNNEISQKILETKFNNGQLGKTFIIFLLNIFLRKQTELLNNCTFELSSVNCWCSADSGDRQVEKEHKKHAHVILSKMCKSNPWW